LRDRRVGKDILVGKPEGKSPFGKSKPRQEDFLK